MIVYADSSFVASIYIPDVHTPEALRRMGSQPEVWLTPFHEAEVAHTLSQSVFRGRIREAQADLARRAFEADRATEIWKKVDFPLAAFHHAVELALCYGAQLGSRTLDSLHVACALELKAGHFWTFDERQAKLARAAGLKTS